MLNIQKGLAFTDNVIYESPPPQFLVCPTPPPPLRVQHAWRKKNFKNPGTNQRILKAKLIAIYLDCHISSANIGFRVS